MTIYDEIQAERGRQNQKWGGPRHDDTHTSHDWIAFIVKHAGAAVMWPWKATVYRTQMIRVAALAVAAVEWIDRNGLAQKENDRDKAIKELTEEAQKLGLYK